ncbi:hypothetical protein [Roseimaritima ulvae]|uniref:DUF3352 domain-containing protein n=2 Tax=Roseimaritima ulvae TaxID=980254 RepID=A0A5B9R2K2_9BACT|nr:hypothetical protein [Roseimaritima ulvae]QEG43646.1 hypothetical protein UC8_56980 [Roseimaritima ulvae]
MAAEPAKPSWQAAELLPETVIAYAELSNLGDGVEMLLHHPLRDSIEALPAYQEVLKDEGFGKLQQGVAAFEGAMDMPWNEALATLSAGGVAVALDAQEGGVALLAKSSSEEKLKRFRGFLTVIRNLQPKSESRGGTYRGFNAEPLGDKLKVAFVDDLLLITNNSNLGKAIIDRYLDADQASLQNSDRFQLAWSTLSPAAEGQASVSAFVDVTTVRSGGLAKGLFKEKTENPLEELLLGGLFANLQHTPYATAKLDLHPAGLRLRLSTPHQRDWEPPREHFFGTAERPPAPPLLLVDDRLFAVTTQRDLSQMWLRAGDLMTDKANDGLAQADTQLTTFFSGRDFGEDILGSFQDDIQIVGKAQDFENVLPRPAIKLPAFAIQVRMQDPAETQTEMRRIFQSFIGFLNVVGAMEGQPQFDLDSETIDDAKLYTATYVPERDARESVTAPINFNFSPTLAFHNDRMIVASAAGLARELVTAPKAPARQETESNANANENASKLNTAVTLDARTLQSVLRANRDQLVAQNMIEEGHSQEVAENETDFLLDVIGYFRSLRIDFSVTDDALQLGGELSLQTERTE